MLRFFISSTIPGSVSVHIYRQKPSGSPYHLAFCSFPVHFRPLTPQVPQVLGSVRFVTLGKIDARSWYGKLIDHSVNSRVRTSGPSRWSSPRLPRVYAEI